MSAAIVSAFHHDFRDVYKGLQSHRATSDFRQHMSLALERQLSGQLVNTYAASSLINIPVASQGSTVPALTAVPGFSAVKSPTKQHAPLTASNSVANCNAASHIKTTVNREHRKLDRSVSEPADRSQTLRPAQPNSSRYKTELCRPFEENGTCKYGDKCQFAHGIGELRTLTRHPKYKTELCRTFHSTGFCPYGPRCHFIHNSEDSKKCLMNTLQSNGSVPVNNITISPPKLSSTHAAPKDLDICSFSLGSAGDLSPTSSTSSSGSPTSSLSGFFMDDNTSYLPQVPHTAPPTVNTSFFFNGNYSPLKSLSTIPALVSPQEFTTGFPAEESIIPGLDMLVSEMDNINCSDGASSKADSPTKTETSTTLDINRNIIRLPIFSRLSHGSP